MSSRAPTYTVSNQSIPSTFRHCRSYRTNLLHVHTNTSNGEERHHTRPAAAVVGILPAAGQVVGDHIDLGLAVAAHNPAVLVAAARIPAVLVAAARIPAVLVVAGHSLAGLVVAGHSLAVVHTAAAAGRTGLVADRRIDPAAGSRLAVRQPYPSSRPSCRRMGRWHP